MCFERIIARKRTYYTVQRIIYLKKNKSWSTYTKIFEKGYWVSVQLPDAIDVYNWYLICTNISLTAMTTYRYLLLHAELKIKSMIKWFIDIIIRYRNHHTTKKHWRNTQQWSSGLWTFSYLQWYLYNFWWVDQIYYITSGVLHGLKNNH